MDQDPGKLDFSVGCSASSQCLLICKMEMISIVLMPVSSILYSQLSSTIKIVIFPEFILKVTVKPAELESASSLLGFLQGTGNNLINIRGHQYP